MNADNGVEILGNLVQANENSVNTQYYAANNGLYGYFDVFRKAVGSIVDPENQNQVTLEKFIKLFTVNWYHFQDFLILLKQKQQFSYSLHYPKLIT